MKSLLSFRDVQHEIYRQILIDSGGNQIDMPHPGIRKHRRAGADPCDRDVPQVYLAANPYGMRTKVSKIA